MSKSEARSDSSVQPSHISFSFLGFDGCGRASLCNLNAAKVTLVKRLDSAPRGQLVTTARRAAEGRVARRLGLARG